MQLRETGSAGRRILWELRGEVRLTAPSSTRTLRRGNCGYRIEGSHETIRCRSACGGNPLMQLSRRSFMAFLTAAPFVFDPNRKIFDMGRSKIWTPPPPEIIPAELGPSVEASINAVLAHYGERIADLVFTPSPIFSRLINGNSKQELLRK